MNISKMKGLKHSFTFMGERVNIVIKPEFTGESYDELVANGEEDTRKSFSVAKGLALSLSSWDLEDNDGPIPVGSEDDAEEIYRRVPLILIGFINNELEAFVKRGGLGKKSVG